MNAKVHVSSAEVCMCVSVSVMSLQMRILALRDDYQSLQECGYNLGMCNFIGMSSVLVNIGIKMKYLYRLEKIMFLLMS